MDYIISHYGVLLQIVGAAVSLATLIVGLTPSTDDDKFVGKIVKFIEYFSVLNKK